MARVYTWLPGDTWVKVAWKKLGEETRYRELLEANPGFTPNIVPEPGFRIRLPSGSDPISADETVDNNFFPWASRGEAIKRLLDYTAVGILLDKKINGPSISQG